MAPHLQPDCGKKINELQSFIYFALINRTGALFERILTEVVRTVEVV